MIDSRHTTTSREKAGGAGDELRFTRTAVTLLLLGSLLLGTLGGGAAALLISRSMQRAKVSAASPANDTSPSSAIAAAEPITVAITTVGAIGDQGTPSTRPPRSALGTGVVLNLDGHILTTSGVVGEYSDVQTVFSDGREARATVVGRDEETGLAVLKVNNTAPGEPAFAAPAKLEVGERVIALGTSPTNLSRTAGDGTISALGFEAELGGRQKVDNLIQTDASAPQGGAGGPLVNEAGEVIGITLRPADAENRWSLVLPANTARAIAGKLIKNGNGPRASLAISHVMITPQIARVRKINQQGALVLTVLKGSPVAGKLKPGDVITSVNGKVVNEEQTLQARLATFRPGQRVKLRVVRGDLEVNVLALLTREQTAPALTPTALP